MAVAILTNAAATGGFQISEESAMSNGADAINRLRASANDQWMRRDKAVKSQTSAVD